MLARTRILLLLLLASAFLFLHAAPPPAHDQFRVAVYIPVGVVERMKDPAFLQKSWDELSSQVKVDKVYIESYRSGVFADDASLDAVKAFFTSHGVEVAGGIAYAAGGDTAGFTANEVESGQFISFCFTDPRQRDYVKHVAEVTARHFDEIMLDDFLLQQHQARLRYRGQGQCQLERFPPAAHGWCCARLDSRAGARRQSQGESHHQVPQLV